MGRTQKLKDKTAVSEEIQPNPDMETILGESKEGALPQYIEDADRILNP